MIIIRLIAKLHNSAYARTPFCTLQDSGYVFTSNRGTALEPRNVTRLFVSTLKKEGLDRIKLHEGTRHTAATLMLAQGIPVKVVSELLGHARTGMTQDVYSHVMRSQQQAAAAAMDALLSVDDGAS